MSQSILCRREVMACMNSEMNAICDTDEMDTVLLEASQEYEHSIGNLECENDEMDAILLEASQEYERSIGNSGCESDEMDAILLEASQEYERSVVAVNCECDIGEAVCVSEVVDKQDQQQSKVVRFGTPVTNEDLEVVQKSGVPKNTSTSTRWALNVWKEWVIARKSMCLVEDSEKEYVISEKFFDMPVEAISFWLPKFIVEVRNKKGESYPPDTLYGLCCGLQRSLKENDLLINFFTDKSFNKTREVLDAYMKKLKSTGNFEKRSSDIITDEMEDRLWEVGVLGDSNPQSLLDSLFYYIGLYFALRGGDEHRRLRFKPG